MDVTTVIDLIMNNGVSIAMIAYFIYDKNKTTQPLVDAINNNTHILTRLLDSMHKTDLMEGE